MHVWRPVYRNKPDTSEMAETGLFVNEPSGITQFTEISVALDIIKQHQERR